MEKLKAVSMLEDRLAYIWSKTKQARNQEEFRKIREEALKVYNDLKKTKELLGII